MIFQETGVDAWETFALLTQAEALKAAGEEEASRVVRILTDDEELGATLLEAAEATRRIAVEKAASLLAADAQESPDWLGLRGEIGGEDDEE